MNQLPPAQHCPHAEHAAAYVLRALEPEEAEAYDRHLRECPACRDDVARLQRGADVLAQAPPRVTASDDLRDRVMAQVRAEAELLRAAGPGADRPARRRRRRPHPLAAVTAAAALGCGVGVGFIVSGAGHAVAPRTVQAYVAPTMRGARAELIRIDGRAELTVSGIAQPPPRKIYQVWLARPGLAPQPTDALFSVNRAGSGSVAVPGDLSGVRRVMVTAEPLGGSSHPTSTPIVIVTL